MVNLLGSRTWKKNKRDKRKSKRPQLPSSHRSQLLLPLTNSERCALNKHHDMRCLVCDEAQHPRFGLVLNGLPRQVAQVEDGDIVLAQALSVPFDLLATVVSCPIALLPKDNLEKWMFHAN